VTTTAAAAASATFGVCSTGQFSGDQSRLGRVSGSLKEPSRIASECQSGIFYGPDALPITSDGVLTHVSRLETSRDTYLHVSVLAQSRHIRVLSWLEYRSSMYRLGSVSWLSWCVLAQCVLRSWHIRFEQLMLVRCNQHLMWHSMTVWQ